MRRHTFCNDRPLFFGNSVPEHFLDGCSHEKLSFKTCFIDHLGINSTIFFKKKRVLLGFACHFSKFLLDHFSSCKSLLRSFPTRKRKWSFGTRRNACAGTSPGAGVFFPNSTENNEKFHSNECYRNQVRRTSMANLKWFRMMIIAE